MNMMVGLKDIIFYQQFFCLSKHFAVFPRMNFLFFSILSNRGGKEKPGMEKKAPVYDNEI